MKDLQITKKVVMDYLVITVGVTLLAVCISMFFSPYSMVTGGVTGLAIIIQKVSGDMGYPIPLWVTNLAFNIPLFILGARAKGKRFLAKTVYATMYLSLALYFTDQIPPMELDLTLVAVFGGVLDGIAIGLVFRSMASTGGSDLLASILNKYYPHLSIQKLLLGIDFCVISLGFFVFGPLRAMYAIIAVYIISKVIETVLEGFNFAKAAFIISDNAEEISKELMEKLERGVTSLQGKGMYTGGAKNVMLCVVSSKEIISVKDIVYSVDPRAFVMVTDVREVLGEGFKEKV